MKRQRREKVGRAYGQLIIDWRENLEGLGGKEVKDNLMF